MSKQYKLCYVDNNVLFFTDNFKNQWGDDWDDAPYECNAGEPYDRKDYPEYDDKWCVEHGKGNIRKIAFYFYDGYNIEEPKKTQMRLARLLWVRILCESYHLNRKSMNATGMFMLGMMK